MDSAEMYLITTLRSAFEDGQRQAREEMRDEQAQTSE